MGVYSGGSLGLVADLYSARDQCTNNHKLLSAPARIWTAVSAPILRANPLLSPISPYHLRKPFSHVYLSYARIPSDPSAMFPRCARSSARLVCVIATSSRATVCDIVLFRPWVLNVRHFAFGGFYRVCVMEGFARDALALRAIPCATCMRDREPIAGYGVRYRGIPTTGSRCAVPRVW